MNAQQIIGTNPTMVIDDGYTPPRSVQKTVIPVAGSNPMQVVDNGDGTVTIHPHPALKHLTLPRVIFTDTCGKVFHKRTKLIEYPSYKPSPGVQFDEIVA